MSIKLKDTIFDYIDKAYKISTAKHLVLSNEYTEQELNNRNFELLEEEKLLFNILISIPYKVNLDSSEFDRCKEFRRLINYLGKASSIVIDI